MVKRFIKTKWPYLAVILLAICIISPQLISGKFLVCSDTLFHDNRFYDTAMQISHLNFSYFASTYGYNQCGRIVNAVYGPYFAYLNGFLLLICHTYYNFQIVSDLLVFVLASISLTVGLKIANLWQANDRFLVLLYPFTYQIARFVTSNNFTAWGTVILPLAVGCVARMYTNPEHPINPLQYGIITALIVQIHMVTSLEMVIIYVLFVPFAWHLAFNRKKFFINLMEAAFLAICLDLNVISGLIETFWGNHITPLSRLALTDERIFSLSNSNGGQFITTALFILVTLLALIVLDTRSKVAWWFGSISIIFYVLSMPLPGWKELFITNKIVGVFQYPSRLLVPAITLSAFFLGFIIKEDLLTDWLQKTINIIECLFVACSVTATIFSVQSMCKQIIFDKPMVQPTNISYKRRVSRIETGSKKGNLRYLLMHAYQGVADYMPMSQRHSPLKAPHLVYWSNLQRIIKPQAQHQGPQFYKTSINHKIITIYYMPKYGRAILPLVKYRHTDIQIDHNPLSDYHVIYPVNLKSPSVELPKGKHIITSVYKPNWVNKMLVFISLLTWILCGASYSLWRASKWNEHHRKLEEKRKQPLIEAVGRYKTFEQNEEKEGY